MKYYIKQTNENYQKQADTISTYVNIHFCYDDSAKSGCLTFTCATDNYCET